MTSSARVIDIRDNTSWLFLNSYDINHLWEYCLTHANENFMLCVLKHIYTSIMTHLQEKRQSTYGIRTFPQWIATLEKILPATNALKTYWYYLLAYYYIIIAEQHLHIIITYLYIYVFV